MEEMDEEDLVPAEALIEEYRKEKAAQQAMLPGEWVEPPNSQYHPCTLPAMTYADAGRRWRCKECGAYWMLYRGQAPISQITRAFSDAMPKPQTFPAIVTREEVAESVNGVNERYAPTDLYAPNSGVRVMPEANVTALHDHSESCAHRLGTGMCSCHVRKTL